MDTVNVEVTREKLLKDLHAVVAETEQLLRDTATVGGDKVASWRVGVEQNLKAAKEKLGRVEHAVAAKAWEMERAVVEKAKEKAMATDAYVHEKPWQAIGITAGVGVLVGLAVGMMLNRR